MRAELIAQLETLLQEGGNRLPPVQRWNPPLSGDIDIRIARNGDWYHEGTRFERHALVRMFATILKREGDEFFLVTPGEKWRLRVEDAPFTAIDCEVIGSGAEQQLVFVTNVDDRVHCNAEHPLRVVTDVQTGEPSPYVMVRDGLEARIVRSVFYRLVERAEAVDGVAGVRSAGIFFPLA
ncbi:MAG: DUF1285 domain-containing protein [Pseudomonadota bacterium]